MTKQVEARRSRSTSPLRSLMHTQTKNKSTKHQTSTSPPKPGTRVSTASRQLPRPQPEQGLRHSRPTRRLCKPTYPLQRVSEPKDRSRWEKGIDKCCETFREQRQLNRTGPRLKQHHRCTRNTHTCGRLRHGKACRVAHLVWRDRERVPSCM